MTQVGDKVKLTVAPTPSGSNIYSYVWDFWDGSSTATAVPFVTKVVNIGGQPGTDQLWYTCRPVAVDGNSVTLSGSFTANNPPVLLSGDVSVNDSFFTYQTTLEVVALDLDGDALSFNWYSGTSYIGTGTTASAGTMSGTWSGNGTVIVGGHAAFANSLDLAVASSRIVTCYVVDARGGTTALSFGLTGESNPVPSTSISAGIAGVSFDASTPAQARIGTGAMVNFTVSVMPLPSHTLGFSWSFSGSNGWTMAPSTASGVTTQYASGVYRNSVNRDISSEFVSSGTSKVAVANVRVTATNNTSGQVTYADSQFEITLVKNSAPTGVVVNRTVSGVAVLADGPVTSGAAIEFSASALDADSDVLLYKWQFAQPFLPNTVYFWGPKVVYSTVGYTSADVVQGQLTVIDRLGAEVSVVLPLTNIFGGP